MKRNKFYVFNVEKPLHFVYCGKAIWKEGFIHDKRVMKDYEIFIVNSGKLYMEQENIKSEVKSKEMLFHLPNIIHKGHQVNQCVFYWLHFTANEEPTIFSYDELNHKIKTDPSYFKKKIIIPHHLEFNNYQSIMLLVSHLLQSVITIRNQDYEDYMITLITLEITKQIISEFNIKTTYNIVPIRLNMIVEDIKNNLSKKINIRTLSEKFNYSEKYLSHLFKKHLNMTPHAYILNQKIEYSKLLLIDSDHNIKDIAYLLGFDDEHHFMRIFKKHTNTTATLFRKTYSKTSNK